MGINDFVWVEIVLEKDRFPLDTSQPSGVVDFLYQLDERFHGQEDITSNVPVYFSQGKVLKLSNGDSYILNETEIKIIASHYDGVKDKPLMIIKLYLSASLPAIV